MVMPLLTQHAGQITFEVAAGDVVEAGALVARLELVDTTSAEQQVLIKACCLVIRLKGRLCIHASSHY